MMLSDCIACAALVYLASSPIMLIVMLGLLSNARREIRDLKSDIDRIDADLDDFLGPSDPDDDGEDNQEMAPSNVIAFGRKAS